jgi:dihydrofolate synthase/folylpolyglutamate synthase
MIKEISRVADYLIISKNKSKRAAEIADQVEYAEKYRIDYITAIDVVTATRRALAKAEADDVIIITGSLYTISEVLAEKMFVEN